MTYKRAFCKKCNRNATLTKVKGGWKHLDCGTFARNPKYKIPTCSNSKVVGKTTSNAGVIPESPRVLEKNHASPNSNYRYNTIRQDIIERRKRILEKE